MSHFSANLTGLSPLLAPDQAMVNDISRQLNEGETCTPHYTPFVLAQLHQEPWRSPLPAHDKVVDDWSDRMKSLRSIQPLPFQAYLFYQLRFIMAAHLCSAWETFGGISAQLNAISVMLNLSVVENSGFAVAYDLLMRKHIAHLARQRRVDVDFNLLLSKENEDIKKQVVAQRTGALKSKGDKDDPKKKGKKGKGKQGAEKKPWEKPWGKKGGKSWNQQPWIVRSVDPRSDCQYGPPAHDSQPDRRRSEKRSRSKRNAQEQPSSSNKKKDKR